MVLKNKGEKVRARLVVTEIKKAKSEYEKLEPSDVFSAMPPVESLKALVSHNEDEFWFLQCLTYQKRIFTECERDVYVEPLAELHRPGLVAKLNKTMHGTKDASNAWQKLWGEHLRNNGFELRASNPASYRSGLVTGVCHGDDFVTTAAEDQIEVFGKFCKRNLTRDGSA